MEVQKLKPNLWGYLRVLEKKKWDRYNHISLCEYVALLTFTLCFEKWSLAEPDVCCFDYIACPASFSPISTYLHPLIIVLTDMHHHTKQFVWVLRMQTDMRHHTEQILAPNMNIRMKLWHLTFWAWVITLCIFLYQFFHLPPNIMIYYYIEKQNHTQTNEY